VAYIYPFIYIPTLNSPLIYTDHPRRRLSLCLSSCEEEEEEEEEEEKELFFL
jgi:hypothetical protein